MSEIFTLTPAYGRDYKSADEVRGEWEAQRDFIIESINGLPRRGGKYINKQDAPAGSIMRIRFNKLRNVVEIKVPA